MSNEIDFDFEKALENADPQQILKLAEAMKKLALLVANKQVKKMLIRKLTQRVGVVEKNVGIENSDDSKWPSVTGD